MPQLDTLTFFSQAVTLLVLVTFMFIFVSTILLPALFRIQKIRKFFCLKSSSTDYFYSRTILNLLLFKNFIITSSVSESADIIESVGAEFQTSESTFDFDDLMSELSVELCQFELDRFVIFEDEESEFGKSSLFEFDEEEFEDEFDELENNE